MSEQDGKKETVVKLPDEFLQTITSMGDGMKALAEGMGKINSRIDDIEKSTEGPEKKVDKKKNIDNLELLDRKSFMGVMLDEMKEIIADAVTPVKNSIENNTTNAGKEKLQKEIKKAQAANADFNEWGDEILDIAKKNPGISPQRAYVIARAENPNKAEKMDEKFKTDDQKKKEEKGALDAKAASSDDIAEQFGGLLPTSGSVVDSDKLDGDKAADIAWDKTFGNVSDIP